MQTHLDCKEELKGSLPAPSIFDLNAQGHFTLSEGVQLHMFISQPPCGSACVIASNQQPVSTLPNSGASS